MKTVLISGAGVAGPTLAYWLARNGFRPTVIERAQGQRSSGNPVDVRGPALPVAEAMGIIGQLREAATRVTAMRIVDADGERLDRIPVPATSSAAGNREIEIPRADLAAILYEAARGDAEFVFDDTITSLDQDEHGVDVTFERLAPRRFDLVVGADGLHSAVRRVAFGPETEYVHHLGVYVATLPLGEPVDHPREVLMYNTPGRLISIHPSRANAIVAFIFRGPALDDFDHRDTGRHKRVIVEAYHRDRGWRVPELLDRVRQTDELYFDSVSKVHLPSWSHGRVTLLGDAASCVSLFGDGSSMAMAGAYTLAGALADSDYETAFRRYESAHRGRTDSKQRRAGLTAAIFVPKTRLGLAARNLATRVLLARG